MVFTTFGVTQDHIHSIKLQPDGKLLAGGYSNDAMALTRYLNDGSLDSTFGINGLVASYISPASQAIINGLALSPDGIYACGFAIDSTANSILVKYDYSGDLIPGFGLDGVVINNLAEQDLYKDIQIKGDKIIAGGTANTDGIFKFTLSQMDLNGNAVTSFGTNGVFVASPSDLENELHAIALQEDGKILATGSCKNYPYDIGIVRVLSDSILSIDNWHPEVGILIYPNPAHSMLNVSAGSSPIKSIRIYNSMGQLIKEVYKDLDKIDISTLPNAPYLISIETNSLQLTRKFVKK